MHGCVVGDMRMLCPTKCLPPLIQGEMLEYQHLAEAVDAHNVALMSCTCRAVELDGPITLYLYVMGTYHDKPATMDYNRHLGLTWSSDIFKREIVSNEEIKQNIAYGLLSAVQVRCT